MFRKAVAVSTKNALMVRFFSNPQYRFIGEFLCGLAAQGVVFLLFALLWHPAWAVPEFQITLALGASMLIGPQAVFVIHPGDMRDKLQAAAGYIAAGFALMLICFVVMFAVMGCLKFGSL